MAHVPLFVRDPSPIKFHFLLTLFYAPSAPTIGWGAPYRFKNTPRLSWLHVVSSTGMLLSSIWQIPSQWKTFPNIISEAFSSPQGTMNPLLHYIPLVLVYIPLEKLLSNRITIII